MWTLHPKAYAWQEVHDFLSVFGPPQNLRSHYNIAPTMDINVVVAQEGARMLTRMRWGLCPGWWKKTLSELPATFNARARWPVSRPVNATGRADDAGLIEPLDTKIAW